MKVFNWVNRRLLYPHSKTSSFQGDRPLRDVRSKIDVDKQALLEHGGHVMVDVLHDWKDGILAIGTLAIGPLDTTHHDMESCDHVKEVDDDHDHGDQEVTNNHVLEYPHDDIQENNDDDDDDDDDDDGDGDDIKACLLVNIALLSHENEKVGSKSNERVEEVVEDVVDLKDKIKEGETTTTRKRVTLADLFMEDCDHRRCNYPRKVGKLDDANKEIIAANPKLKIKHISCAKDGLSKAKKVLKQDLLPLKKIKQLMKRMMKRKIHPDMESNGKTQKKAVEMQPHRIPTPADSPPPSLPLIQEVAM